MLTESDWESAWSEFDEVGAHGLERIIEETVAERVRAAKAEALRGAANEAMQCQCSDECHIQRLRFLRSQREWLSARADQYDRAEA